MRVSFISQSPSRVLESFPTAIESNARVSYVRVIEVVFKEITAVAVSHRDVNFDLQRINLFTYFPLCLIASWVQAKRLPTSEFSSAFYQQTNPERLVSSSGNTVRSYVSV